MISPILKDLLTCYATQWPIFLKKRNNCRVKWHGTGGRTANGRILTHTKSSYFIKRRLIKIALHYLLTTMPFFVLKEYKKILRRRYNLLMVAGCLTLTAPAPTKILIGEFYHKPTFEKLKKSFFYNTIQGFSYGKQVSYVQYKSFFLASSLGSFCTIIFSYVNNYVLILPSGYLKVVDALTMAVDSDLPSIQFRKFRKGARLLLIKGRKSTVRGIAKNPNDHPHGGRTNTVLRPQTPWGLFIRKSKINKKIVHNSRSTNTPKVVSNVENESINDLTWVLSLKP